MGMEMVNEIRSSDPVDPFENYSVLSLFPQTFRDLTAHNPNPNDPNDVESIHSYLKSTALRSPNKLLDQAKTIVDSGSEVVYSKFPSHIAYEDKNEFVAAKGKENPQARRPGLGRKRARFSLKPNSSQPTVTLEPTLDIDQLQDPVEYFLAYEKFENAKKELQRQRGGVLMDLNQNNPATTVRHRRPGILGRSYSYKHHQYPSMLSNNDEAFISSQERFERDILSPSDPSLQQETTDPDVVLQERELVGSIVKTDNIVSELLDELLSVNCEDLDGDGALTLLQERLQIKPLDLDKLCLPDLHDIQRNDLTASGGNLPKPGNSLSDIHNKLKGIRNKTPVKDRQEEESSVHPSASPTPPKSPFASISLLKRHILRSNPLNDPFSALNVDLSPTRNSSPVECRNKQSDQVDTGKELSVSGKFKSLILHDNDTAVANTGSIEVLTEDSTGPFENSLNENLNRGGVGIDVRSSGSHGDLEDNVGGGKMDDRVMDDNSSGPDTGTDARTNGANEPDDKVEDMVQEAVASVQPDLNIEDSTIEKLDSSWNQSSSGEVEHHVKDGPFKTLDNGSEQHIEKVQEPSRILILHEQTKEKTPQRQVLNDPKKAETRLNRGRKRKELSRRQSLAGAGTSWQSGVRRSTRIKTRPLEYWKGERFLYGRINKSLATVIGLKYVSPAKGDGKPTIKVRSYVSDEYKELVELAALH